MTCDDILFNIFFDTSRILVSVFFYAYKYTNELSFFN